jgi:hypothetical protein
MAVAALTRFTVPLASDQSSTSQGLLMPKLKFRFRITFTSFGISTPTTELTKQVVDFKRPEADFENIVLDVYNSKINLAGKPTWGDVTINLRDDATGTVTKLVGEQIQKQFDFYEQVSASSGIDYKFTTMCEMLDGGNGSVAPIVLETWNLYGCYVQRVDYGEVAYNSNEPVQIALTLKIDDAIQTPLGSGIGANIPRSGGVVATG